MTELPSAHLDDLRRRTHLADLIGRSVRLQRSGRLHKGRCPVHAEQTPSFLVYADHFHCFGCGVHGDAFSWMMRTTGVSFRESVALVKRLSGARNATQYVSNVPTLHDPTLSDYLVLTTENLLWCRRSSTFTAEGLRRSRLSRCRRALAATDPSPSRLAGQACARPRLRHPPRSCVAGADNKPRLATGTSGFPVGQPAVHRVRPSGDGGGSSRPAPRQSGGLLGPRPLAADVRVMSRQEDRAEGRSIRQHAAKRSSLTGSWRQRGSRFLTGQDLPRQPCRGHTRVWPKCKGGWGGAGCDEIAASRNWRGRCCRVDRRALAG